LAASIQSRNTGTVCKLFSTELYLFYRLNRIVTLSVVSPVDLQVPSPGAPRGTFDLLHQSRLRAMVTWAMFAASCFEASVWPVRNDKISFSPKISGRLTSMVTNITLARHSADVDKDLSDESRAGTGKAVSSGLRNKLHDSLFCSNSDYRR
jgi:hypothetical protein